MCWAWDRVEGELEELYWKFSIYELTQKVQLKLGFQTSVLLSQHTSMVDIANALFADGTKPTAVDPLAGYRDVTAGAPSMEAAVMNMNSILNWG